MKNFFSLVLALVMALSLMTVAWGATVEVNDYTTFTAAIADGNEIKLTADIEVTAGVTIPAGMTVTIDLNGFDLYAGGTGTSFTSAFTMITNKGTLTIKDSSAAKDGMISIAGEISDANYATYGFPTFAVNAITNSGTLTLESGTISVSADKDATTPKVATYAVDNNSGTGDAILNINGGALINEHNVAIRQFCNSTTYKNEVNITAGEVTGTRAVWIQLPGSNSAHEQKAALNVEGGTLTATGTSDGYNLAVYSYSYGASSTATEINISGGTFEGDVAIGGGAKNGSETMNITGGTFEGAVYTYNTDTTETAGKLEISGGTFAVAPDDALLADDFALVQDTNGNYVPVTASSITPAAGAKSAYYTTDLDNLSVYPACDLDNYKYELKKPYTTGSDAAKTFTQVAIWETNKISGASQPIIVAVVASAESANLAFVSGSTVTYLNTNETQWDIKVTAVKTVDFEDVDDCGQKFTKDDVAAYIDGNNKLYVEDFNGDVVANVGGKLVILSAATSDETTYTLEGLDGVTNANLTANVVYIVKHDYAADTKMVAGEEEVTKVYCAECKKSFAFVVGGPADAIDEFGAGNYTDTGLDDANDDNIYVALKGVSAGSAGTPSTDKTVTSADTFDAGIAMYVGMSVMAAAGSVVVLKKRED